MPDEKDTQLWRIAQRRAAFRKNLYSYLVINAFLWAVWWFTIGKDKGFTGYPWPVWIMLGWGLGLGIQYFKAYQGTKSELADEEYERLKRRKEL